MEKKKLSPLEVADSWAFYTIKIWKEKLSKLRINHSGELKASFLKQVVGTAQGEIISIKLSFKYNGKFVDMGVGRGTKIGDVSQNKTSRLLEGRMLGNRRRPKKWYGKTFYAEVITLKEILEKEYAHKGILQVVENIGDNSNQ